MGSEPPTNVCVWQRSPSRGCCGTTPLCSMSHSAYHRTPKKWGMKDMPGECGTCGTFVRKKSHRSVRRPGGMSMRFSNVTLPSKPRACNQACGLVFRPNGHLAQSENHDRLAVFRDWVTCPLGLNSGGLHESWSVAVATGRKDRHILMHSFAAQLIPHLVGL